MEKQKVSQFVGGSEGTPGTGFCRKMATVFYIATGRWELLTRIRWGSNQVCLEEHGRHERRYRADSLGELLAVSISETKADSEMNDPELLQAIREAIFDAEDTSPNTDDAA